MEVSFVDLNRINYINKDSIENAVLKVLNSGWYILGKEVSSFENDFANYIGVDYCIGLNSGLDAIVLGLKALGIKEGDEIIVPANTFIASILGVSENGAIPVFIEPDKYYNIDPNKVKEAITKKTKAIMCVHLYGQPCQMDQLVDIARENNLLLIEDCAQAHGAKYKGDRIGTFGDISCFSFYPTKNLGAYGDAGAVLTKDIKISEKLKALRNYGAKEKYHHEILGVNSRLDEIQAVILKEKLKNLDDQNRERKILAEVYNSNIKNQYVKLPEILLSNDHVYHLYVIRCIYRDELMKYLKKNNIQTQIHYPIPPHLSQCYKYLGYTIGDFPITEGYSKTCLSLPLFNGMTRNEINYVIEVINNFTI